MILTSAPAGKVNSLSCLIICLIVNLSVELSSDIEPRIYSISVPMPKYLVRVTHPESLENDDVLLSTNIFTFRKMILISKIINLFLHLKIVEY